MITKLQYDVSAEYTIKELKKAGIVLTQEEQKCIEVADFGLGRLDEVGLQVVTYVNTDRCCAKELVLKPDQICPEHLHPNINGNLGKEETFRCRKGEVYLYVSGNSDENAIEKIKKDIPSGMEPYFTVFNEIQLKPGEQYTLKEGMLHWFKAGASGCIVSEFSTKSVDEADIFTDPHISRIPEME